jgi:hypothetical protein
LLVAKFSLNVDAGKMFGQEIWFIF